jgi:RimJ/RimL family protein N-acetyltransferase
VTEEVLAALVEAAIADADPNEVTPPDLSGPEWTPARIDWLQAYHRDRRGGVDGAAREATWAVTVDRAVVGSVRLKATDQAGCIETGIWLCRRARGNGIGRRALEALIDEARREGAIELRADTTSGNVGAVLMLERLGFDLRAGEADDTATRQDGRTGTAVVATLSLTGWGPDS